MSARDRDRDFERLDRLATLLDNSIRIPGTRIHIGLDGLIGLVPGIGDSLMLLASLYVVLRARMLGAPMSIILQMLVNVALDFVVGSVPVLGDIFDIAFKANIRNIDLLRNWLSR
ncbi:MULTISPECIES: DUF4112 domain-containing protein [unclassified Minwuia]|jgi:Domain of unknown function (DUF4112)|uniref:DUF4112 domain-containing protein n=1 Tax=unclassified Minwuia TaxID=2618799 RepID=UPI00247A4C9D|nr:MULTISPECIES: DUF4112 domain-containing protein [unclassified Minwuia]